MPRVTVLRGPNAGSIYSVGNKPLEIGRDENCAICVASPEASQRHAEIARKGLFVVLRDLGSASGTLLNSETVSERRLEHGDRISVAGMDLLFELELDETAPPSGGPAVAYDREPLEGVMAEMPSPDVASWVEAVRFSSAEMAAPSRLERRLRVLWQLSRAADVQQGLRQMLDETLAYVLPELGADAAVVFLIDDTTGKLRPFAMRRSERVPPGEAPRVSSTVVNQVMREGLPFLASDAGESLSGCGSVQMQRIRSVLCVPLRAHDKILGVFYVDVRSFPGFYQTEDLHFLATVCAHLAINIENVSLYKKTRESYERLKLASEQLMASEKMSVLGRLSGMVAHELNNPFQAISIAAEMLDEEADDVGKEVCRAEVKDHAAAILHSMRRCAQLVANLLHYSRDSEDTSLVPLSVDRPLEQALSLMKLVIGRRPIALEIRVSQDLPQILGSSSELEQVFINLVKNAADAIEHHGRITIEVKPTTDSVEVCIADTGSGIRQEDLPRIFEELFTTKPIGEGTGLGLPICKRIVERHGGLILVDSAPGRGTTFVLRFPRAAQARVPARAQSVAA